MKTRPVFENFSDFVANLYEMELRNPGSISTLMEGEIYEKLKNGNSFSLPDLLKLKGGLDNDSVFEEAVKNLQVSAYSVPDAAKELKEFSSVIRDLSTEEWIDQESFGIFSIGIIDKIAPYDYGDSGSVEVKGAPSLKDFTSIEKGVQTMTYSEMLALIAAYNASIFMKNLEIQKENIKSVKTVKKIIKGKEKVYNQMPLANPKDQLVLTVTEGNSQIVVTPLGELNPSSIVTLGTPTGYGAGSVSDAFFTQFKYIFPIIKKDANSKEPLSIESRQKLVSPDKTKNYMGVKEYPLKIKEDGKTTFYVTNKAELTEAGKAAAASLSRMFLKINTIVVDGSADKRDAGSPWKDNQELAGARRDEMVKYLQELAKDSNSSLSGASIEPGEIKVQPKEGEGSEDDKMADWRSVSLKVTGEIYDETKKSLDEQKTESKVVTYTEKKMARQYTFDYPELSSDKKQFEDK